jgi:hypothetical protein
MSSRALELALAKGGSFTSKDKKLYINYSQWTDYLTVFWLGINPETQKYNKSTLVFEQEMGEIKRFEKRSIEWQDKLREEALKLNK